MTKTVLFILLTTLVTISVCNAQNGIITNFAGTGSSGNTGDGGPATAARLNGPLGIASDNAGNLYIPDIFSYVIRKINTAGVITTIAGTGANGWSGDGGPATAAMTNANALAIDASGNVYIADGYNNAVRKINTSGVITTIAGTGTGIAGYSGDGGPATAAQMGNVFGIAVDASGNVYVADFTNSVIRKINTSGIITTVAGNGTQGYSGDGGAATAAQLYYPRGLLTDASGNLYIADILNNRIRKVDAAGVITTVVGNGLSGFSGDGGPAMAAEINAPWYMTFNNTGDLYFSDANNNRIRKVNTAGIISTVVGSGASSCSGIGGPALSASIEPSGLIIDQARNIYFAGSNCYNIYKTQLVPTIASDSFSVYIDDLCNGLSLTAVASSTSSLSLRVSFGDNSSSAVPLVALPGGNEAVTITHPFTDPGNYTIKMLLINGTTAIDSITYSCNSLLCNTLPVSFYYDVNGNCIKDGADPLNYLPLTVEVDSNGIAIDTLSATSGFDYAAYGNQGDIYSFRVISASGGMLASCSGGIVADTLQSGSHNNYTKSIGLSCGSTPGFDLAEFVNTQSGRHLFTGNIVVNNAYCNPASATLTATLDPKYNFVSAVPAPASVAGNIVTWNLGDVVASSPQMMINFNCEVPGAWLTPGDTVNTSYSVTPTAGDINPDNNIHVKTDTVKSSYDPNEMSVSPEDSIFTGTQLQYTIEFENTGNDTAHNIYVMDTLSSNVIPSSMRILASSAVMNVIPLKAGGYNILKFDFPNIQLLDSTHHNQCTGMVLFTINAKTGLLPGTTIFNHAGIFFDDNPVVMTNTVENIIKALPIEGTSNTIYKPGVKIYPNPANDELTIKMDQGAYSSFTIANTMGQILMQQQFTTTQATLNVKTLSPGLYYITLRGNNGMVTQKFVKM